MNMQILTERQTLLDLPIEKQKECAARRGMAHDEWVSYQKELHKKFAEHEAKMTGYMDEETSKRFLKKMMSATQNVD